MDSLNYVIDKLNPCCDNPRVVVYEPFYADGIKLQCRYCKASMSYSNGDDALDMIGQWNNVFYALVDNKMDLPMELISMR